jgi:uncharacterized NAD(P)/FAD-binding protein YdhS/HEAT repeat protein
MTATTGDLTPSTCTIAIIGAGFSGTLVATHLLRQARGPLEIKLIERHPEQLFRGVAYSTREDCHVLNVPAGNMSAFPDRPDHFLQWALGRQERLADFFGVDEISPQAFLPRRVYGEYLDGLFKQALAEAHPGVNLEIVHDEVVDIGSDARVPSLTLRSGNTIKAQRVVLALGNFPPADPPVADGSFYRSSRYQRNPWLTDVCPVAAPGESYLMIGSGLTMVDLAIALDERHFRGGIHVVSRRGLLPPAQRPAGETPGRIDLGEHPPTVRSLLRRFRAQLKTSGGNRDWRSLISSMRPHTHLIWGALSLPEKRRFLRHLRPFWDNHRHQLAPAAARKLDAMIGSGRLTIHAGRVERFVEKERGVEVMIRLRGSGEKKSLRVNRVVNCTGSECDYRKLMHPLTDQLIERGRAVPDPVSFGLAVAPNGALIDAEGRASESLFTLGPPRKGTLWETTAVPEIRVQARQLAELLLTSLQRHGDENRFGPVEPPNSAKHRDAEVRRLAVLRLAESEEIDAVPLLEEALGDTERDVRLEAVRVLEEFDGPAVIGALLGALEDADDGVRAAAAEALAGKSCESALLALLNRVDHPDAFVRSAVLRALKPLRSPAALQGALAALQDEDAGVRREAVGVLGYLQTDAVIPALRDAAHDVYPDVRRAAVNALIPRRIASGDSLKDADWRVRQDAAESVGKVKDRKGFEALLAALDDDYWQVRQKAAWSLGELGDVRAVPVLGRLLLSHPESNVRKEAAAALGTIGHADGEPYLHRALNDRDADVRKLARLALQSIERRFEVSSAR